MTRTPADDERSESPAPVGGSSGMGREEVHALVASVPFWYQSFEIYPGIVTPGINPTMTTLSDLEALGLPADASGLRVLDIGCCDGFFSFEMERRGARVLPMDYAPGEKTAFGVAARILGSGLVYQTGNVYDLHPEKHGQFDLVLMLGVLYHLRHPALAFDALRSVMKAGGSLYVETQAVPQDSPGISPELPLWQYLPRDSFNGDFTNKWAPNAAGLAALVGDSEFSIEGSSQRGDRAYLHAVATDDWYVRTARDLDRSAGDPGSRA
ncbi:MAG: methyltransferase domain-containing protein [Thermoanaerobaculia bacterium]